MNDDELNLYYAHVHRRRTVLPPIKLYQDSHGGNGVEKIMEEIARRLRDEPVKLLNLGMFIGPEEPMLNFYVIPHKVLYEMLGEATSGELLSS